MKSKLYYVYDPMCAWCYAFAPIFEQVKQNLPSNIEIVYVTGGLAPHNDQPMPAEMREKIESIWRDITSFTGVNFNHQFWRRCTPRRSTYLSCQAAIVARSRNKEEQMIKAIQEAYYQKAQNPSDEKTLVDAAIKIGLNEEAFTKALYSKEIQTAFEEDLKLVRKLYVGGFPSLLLQYKKEAYPLQIDYHDPKKILDQINNLSSNVYF